MPSFEERLKAILGGVQSGANSVMLGTPTETSAAPEGMDLAAAGIDENKHPQGFLQILSEFARRRGQARLGDLGARKAEEGRQSDLRLKAAQADELTSTTARNRNPPEPAPPPKAAEYLMYVKDETGAGRKPMSFDAWLTSDANRKTPEPRNIDPLSPEGVHAQNQLKTPPQPIGTIQEYMFYMKDELAAKRLPKSFDEWQTEDANRKKVQPPAESGQYIPLTDSSGVVQGAWNPKSGKSAIPPSNAAGLRRTAVPTGTLNKIAEYENSARKIVDLGTSYKPEFVGPTRGAYERSKATGVLSYLPFLTSPEGYGQFSALSADIKNSVIKLITGAQMGQQEAERILQQVPVETDKPEIWASKYEQTRKNSEFLLGEVRRLNSAGGSGASGTAPTTLDEALDKAFGKAK